MVNYEKYIHIAHSFTFHLHLYMSVSTTTSKTSTEYYDPRWIWKRTFRWVLPVLCHGLSILVELMVSLFIYTCTWQWAPSHQKPSQNIIIIGRDVQVQFWTMVWTWTFQNLTKVRFKIRAERRTELIVQSKIWRQEESVELIRTYLDLFKPLEIPHADYWFSRLLKEVSFREHDNNIQYVDLTIQPMSSGSSLSSISSSVPPSRTLIWPRRD